MEVILADRMNQSFGRQAVVEAETEQRTILNRVGKTVRDFDGHLVGLRRYIDLENFIHGQRGKCLDLPIDRLTVHLGAGPAIIVCTFL